MKEILKREEWIKKIKEHLADEPSRILFDGRLAYAKSGDLKDFRNALLSYFQFREGGLEKSAPELFALMREAILNGKQDVVAPYTDIYSCYFDPTLPRLGDQEVFVDGGAQDLFNSFRFASVTRKRYRAIYAFDPDPENISECRGNLPLFDERMHFSSMALSDRAETLYLTGARENARTNLENDTKKGIPVKADRLDNLLNGICPTFIKLHLEGWEEKALDGASEVIRTCRPRLAICLDHRLEDICRIPVKILSLMPDCRLYLRHYSSVEDATILYAFPEM